MKFLRPILLSALTAASRRAADVDGKWAYGVKGDDGQVRPLVATLKADGMKLTGTVNGMNGQRDIKIFNGMTHGDQVMWSSKRPTPNGLVQFDYKAQVAGDEMKIDIVRADGEGAATNCTATRAK